MNGRRDLFGDARRVQCTLSSVLRIRRSCANDKEEPYAFVSAARAGQVVRSAEVSARLVARARLLALQFVDCFRGASPCRNAPPLLGFAALSSQ